MNCLVVGGAGFIGSTVVKELFKFEHKVFVIDNFLTGKRQNLNDDMILNFYNLDVSLTANINNIKQIIIQNNIDTVFHLAALPSVQYSLDYPSKAHENTLTTTINLIESIKNTTVKQIIFSSTSAVYGNAKKIPITEDTTTDPMSFYALQKLMSEQYLQLFSSIHNIKAVCLRYFNVFGENMNNEGAYKSVISTFFEQASKNKPLTIYNDGNQSRDFISVQDVAKANILSSTTSNMSNFSILNVGSGISTTVNEIAQLFNCEKIYAGKRIEPSFSLCDNTAIKSVLNWVPSVSVIEWIKQMLQIKQFSI